MKISRDSVTTLSIMLLVLVWQDASAQSEAKRTPRLEFGTHFTFMSKFDATHDAAELTLEPEEFSRSPNLGLGVRATFNLCRFAALETEWNALPQESEYAGRKSQLFYGLKLGIRKSRFGIFAKARPGYLFFSEDYCDDIPPLGRSYRCLGTLKRNPAIDVGGVLELYTKRLGVIRIDIGDTSVHFNEVNRYRQELGPGGNFADQVYGGRTHNLQVSVGFSFKLW